MAQFKHLHKSECRLVRMWIFRAHIMCYWESICGQQNDDVYYTTYSGTAAQMSHIHVTATEEVRVIYKHCMKSNLTS